MTNLCINRQLFTVVCHAADSVLAGWTVELVACRLFATRQVAVPYAV